MTRPSAESADEAGAHRHPGPLAHRHPGPLAQNLWLGLLCLIWGSTWIIVKTGLDDLPPFTAAGTRMAVATLAMSVIVRMRRGRERSPAPPFGLSAIAGLLNLGINYGIVYWSMQYLPSGWVSMLWAVFPMMMASSGHFFLEGERLRPRQWLGIVGGLAGVFLLLRTDVADLGPEALLAGAVVLLSPLASTIGTTIVKRGGGGFDSNRLTRDGLFIGALPLLAASFLVEDPLAVEWTPLAVGSVVYLAVVGTAVTFGLYYWLLRSAPAYKLSLIAYVTPVIAVVLGTLVRGEPFTANIVAGGVLILGGVVLVVRRRPAPRERAGTAR